MAQLYRNLGDSLHILMEGFHEVEACVYATPKEKEAIKAGIDAIMTIECHMNRSKMMPYAHTDFSQGIETIKEIANCWDAFDKAAKVYRAFKKRHQTYAD